MEQIDLFNVGLKATLSTIAVFLYAIWKVKEHLRVFSVQKFLNDNKIFWIWSLTMTFMVLLTVTLHPPAAEAIKTMIGLDVNGEPTSFLLLGWGLSALVNGLNSKKIEQKK